MCIFEVSFLYFRVLADLPSIVCCGMTMMKWQKTRLKKLHTTYVICSHVAHVVCPTQHLLIMHIWLLIGLVYTWRGKFKTELQNCKEYIIRSRLLFAGVYWAHFILFTHFHSFFRSFFHTFIVFLLFRFMCHKISPRIFSH